VRAAESVRRPGTVEDFDELRTTLETVFNILLMFDGSLERPFDACNLAL
jgi:hypothetical protein